MSISWQAHLLNGVMRVAGLRGSKSPDALRDELTTRKPPSHKPGRAARRGVDIRLGTINDMPVYRVAPVGPTPALSVIWLHGGSYLYEIARPHWMTIRGLAIDIPAVVHVPIYPLAPNVTAAVTVPAVAEVVGRLVEAHGVHHTTLIGDSAGGGLALAVTQRRRDSMQPGVVRLVLIAPWLDVAIDSQEQRDVEPRDHMIDIALLQEAGRMYAGDLPVTDPRVSPIHGELTGLPPIDVFSGTDDVLNLDSRRLAELGEAVGHPVTLHEVPRMQHVYPILPLMPEAADARREIVQLCRTALRRV